MSMRPGSGIRSSSSNGFSRGLAPSTANSSGISLTSPARGATPRFAGSVASGSTTSTAAPSTPRAGAAASPLTKANIIAASHGSSAVVSRTPTATSTAAPASRTPSATPNASASTNTKASTLAAPINTSTGYRTSPSGTARSNNSPVKTPRGRSPVSTPVRNSSFANLNASSNSLLNTNANTTNQTNSSAAALTRQRSNSGGANSSFNRPVSPRSHRASTTGGASSANEATIADLEKKVKMLTEALAAEKTSGAANAEAAKAKENDLAAKLKDSQEAYNRMLGKQLLLQRQRAAEEKLQQETDRRICHMNIAISKEEDALQKSLQQQNNTTAAAAGGPRRINTPPRAGGGGGFNDSMQHSVSSPLFSSPMSAGGGGNDLTAGAASMANFGTAELAMMNGGGANNQQVIAGVARESIEVRRLRRELTQKITALEKSNERITQLESVRITQKAEIEKARREALIAVREKEELQHQTDRLRIQGNLRVGEIELELVEAQGKLVSNERQMSTYENQINAMSNELKIAKSKLKLQTDSEERQGNVRDQLLAATIAKAHLEDVTDRQRRTTLDMNEAIHNLTEETQLLRLEVDKYRAAAVKAGIILKYNPIAPTDLSKLKNLMGAAGGVGAGANLNTTLTPAQQMQLQQLVMGTSARNSISLPAGSTFLGVPGGGLDGSIRGVTPTARSRSSSVISATPLNPLLLSSSKDSFAGASAASPLGRNASFNNRDALNNSMTMTGSPLAHPMPHHTNAAAQLVYDPLAQYQVTLADPNMNYLCVEANAAKRLFTMERDALLTLVLEGFSQFENLFNTHRAMMGTTTSIVEKAVAEMTAELSSNNAQQQQSSASTNNYIGTAPFSVGRGVSPNRALRSSPNRAHVVSSRAQSPITAHLVGSATHLAGPSNQRRAASPSASSPADGGGATTPRGRTPLRSNSAAATTTSYSGKVGQAPPVRGTTPTSKGPLRRFGTPNRTSTISQLAGGGAASPTPQSVAATIPTATPTRSAAGGDADRFETASAASHQQDPLRSPVRGQQTTFAGPQHQSSPPPQAVLSRNPNAPLSHHHQQQLQQAATPTSPTVSAAGGGGYYPTFPAGAAASAHHGPVYVSSWYNAVGKDAVRAWLSLVNVFSPALENSLHNAGFTDMIALSHITEADLVRLSVTPGVRRKLMAAVYELQRKMALIREESEVILRKTYAISSKFAADLDELDIHTEDGGDGDHFRAFADPYSENNSDADDNGNDIIPKQLTVVDADGRIHNELTFDIPSGDAVAHSAPASTKGGASTTGRNTPIMRAHGAAGGLGTNVQSSASNNNGGNNSGNNSNNKTVVGKRHREYDGNGRPVTAEAIKKASIINRERRERMRARAAERLLLAKERDAADISAAAPLLLPTGPAFGAADPRFGVDAIFNEMNDWFADVRIAIQSQSESAEKILQQTALQK